MEPPWKEGKIRIEFDKAYLTTNRKSYNFFETKATTIFLIFETGEKLILFDIVTRQYLWLF